MKSELKKKKVLITGINGFLGGHIARQLLPMDTEIFGIISKSSNLSSGFLRDHQSKIKLIRGDIGKLEFVKDLIHNEKINYIFHCAAKSTISKCQNDSHPCFETNIMGTVNILEAAKESPDIKGILCMDSYRSNMVFEGLKRDVALDLYSTSKYCALLIVNSYKKAFDLPVINIKATNLYGPGDLNIGRLIPKSILKILNNSAPIIYKEMRGFKCDFLYVEDAARAIVQVIPKIRAIKKDFINLGSGTSHRIDDVLNKICSIFDSRIVPEIKDASFLEKELEIAQDDYQELFKILPDFKPLDIEAGLLKTCEWYKKANIDPSFEGNF